MNIPCWRIIIDQCRSTSLIGAHLVISIEIFYSTWSKSGAKYMCTAQLNRQRRGGGVEARACVFLAWNQQKTQRVNQWFYFPRLDPTPFWAPPPLHLSFLSSCYRLIFFLVAILDFLPFSFALSLRRLIIFSCPLGWDRSIRVMLCFFGWPHLSEGFVRASRIEMANQKVMQSRLVHARADESPWRNMEQAICNSADARGNRGKDRGKTKQKLTKQMCTDRKEILQSEWAGRAGRDLAKRYPAWYIYLNAVAFPCYTYKHYKYIWSV